MAQEEVVAIPDRHGWLVSLNEAASVWVPGIHMISVAASELTRDIRQKETSAPEIRIVLEFHSEEGTTRTHPEQFNELVAWLYEADAFVPTLTDAWERDVALLEGT